MKDAIYSALQKVHQSYEAQAQSKLPTFGMPISSVLKEMGIASSELSLEFYQALEELEAEGFIWDESTSNGGFGRVIGAQGDVGYSLGAKIRLAQ